MESANVNARQRIDAIQAALEQHSYVADRGLSLSIHLALTHNMPLFLEGEAGVGKTEVAKVLAEMRGTRLIRLQCYEGLDISTAVYEWNYAAQMLHIRLLDGAAMTDEERTRRIFGPEFMIRRPLLQAIDHDADTVPVLLIDEIDRADTEFEAYLLEVLSDWQISVPEIGTIVAREPPIVILTSNRTREVHDALKRRCIYQWIDYPTADKELRIVEIRVPGIEADLARQVVAFVQGLREIDLYKLPGVAETVNWAQALVGLGVEGLDDAPVDDMLGMLLKHQDDILKLRGLGVPDLVRRAAAEGRGQVARAGR